MTTDIWADLEELPRRTLVELFEDDDGRVAALSADIAGLHFDWSKTHLDAQVIRALQKLADARDFDAHRDALFAGGVVNLSEKRAATHTAERGEGNADDVRRAKALHARMRALIDAIEGEALGPIRHILHIGIGGSALGPELLMDALGREDRRYDVSIVSNIDGLAMEEALDGFHPQETLIAIASKTFTTTETLLNAESALQWLREGGIDDPYGHVIALTASPGKAIEWGVDETRVLPFAESVGGRYSLWSSIGFPAAIGLGWDAFEAMLEGAAEMDRHFRLADDADNMPLRAAFADLYYTQTRGCDTRAVFAYDERLRLLPSYLQQLEMESNGKRTMADGTPLDRPSAPITWGGVGTDAQHAVFQLLHQGTHLVPVEFIASIEAGDVLDEEHHRQLLTNALAQGAALMAGRKGEGARDYPGDRPSATILMDDVEPRTLGALIAFYEHRVFANAVLLGINPFDQFGVELGKDMARAAGDGEGGFDPSTEDLMRRALS